MKPIFVYMLRCGGKWYRRNSDHYRTWGSQNDAAVWTNRQGPAGAKGSLPRGARVDCVIVKFKLEKSC